MTLPISCTADAECDDGVACNGAESCDTATNACVPGAPNTCEMFAWDTSDRLTGVRPLGRDTHVLGYDDADRATSYTPPALPGQPTGEVEVTRDPDGLVTRVDFTAETGRAIRTNRKPDGRPNWVQHDEHTVTFGYDPTTAVLSSLTTEDGIAVTVDQDGPLLESITWSGTAGVSGAVSFGYDELWDVASVTTGGSTANYAYDEDGVVECVGVNVTPDETCSNGLHIIPNLVGRTLTEVMPGTAAVTSSYEWSDLGEGTNTIHAWSSSAGAEQLWFEYQGRDASGRLTHVIEHTATNLDLEYAYDIHGHLTDVWRDDVLTEHYVYGPNGERTAATVDGVVVSPITTDGRDRITQYGAITYGYDAIGRRTTRTDTATGQTTTYTYDLLGALRHVDLPGTTDDIDYLIDGAGRRVGRKVGGVLEKTWIYLDDLRPIAEMDGSGTVTRVFVYGTGHVPDLIVVPAGQPDAGTYRVLTGLIGSVRRIVNVETGDIVQWMDYDAFGRVLTDTNPGWQPLGFAGGLYDTDTGLVRFGARDYDAELGMWTARDQIVFSGEDLDLYRYCNGDPINITDPSGLFVGVDDAVELATVVVVAAVVGVAFAPIYFATREIDEHRVDAAVLATDLVMDLWPVFAKGGKQNVSDSGLADWTDADIAQALSDLSRGNLTREERELKRRLQREQKARGNRNKSKRDNQRTITSIIGDELCRMLLTF